MLLLLLSVSQSVRQSVCLSVCLWVSQSVSQLVSQSVNRQLQKTAVLHQLTSRYNTYMYITVYIQSRSWSQVGANIDYKPPQGWVNDSVRPSVFQSVSLSVSRSVSQSVSQSVQAVCRSVSQSVSQSVSWSVSRSVFQIQNTIGNFNRQLYYTNLGHATILKCILQFTFNIVLDRD